LIRDYVFDACLAPEKMMEIARVHAKRSSHRGVDGISPSQFWDVAEEECRQAASRIDEFRYRFTRFREIRQLKEAGNGVRTLSVPTVRDRVVMYSLKNYLESRGFPKGPGTPGAVNARVSAEIERRRHSPCHIIRTDVRKFFPSINRGSLLSFLGKLQLDDRGLCLLKSLLSPSDLGGVPQGLPISTCLTEVYMDSLVKDYFSSLKNRDIFAIRYVDDILIMGRSSSEVHGAFSAIQGSIAKAGLELAPTSSDKGWCGTLTEGFSFLGYSYGFDGVSIPQAKISKVLNTVAKILTEARREAGRPGLSEKSLERAVWRYRASISGCRWRGKWRGWVPYYADTNDYSSFAFVDEKVDKLCKKFGISDRSLFPSVRAAFRDYKKRRPAGALMDLDSYSLSERMSWLLDHGGVGKSEIRKLSDDQIDGYFGSRVDTEIRRIEVDHNRRY
jgi:RNA-directed DNA polymerase